MNKDYLNACEDDIIKDKNDCCICYKPGYHKTCSKIFVQRQIEIKKQIHEAKLKETESDLVFLNKYSVTGAYIACEEENKGYGKIKEYFESKVDIEGHGILKEMLLKIVNGGISHMGILVV